MPTEVKGAVALRKALRKFTPDLAKETQKEIASFLKPVVRTARGYMPSNDAMPSGFVTHPRKTGKFPMYEAAIAKRGITYRTSPSKANRKGFRSLASILNKSAAGAIYETAGRKSGNTGNFTPRLGGSLTGSGQKMTGRAMYKAWAEDQGKAQGYILKAIFKAGDKFNQRTKL